jgi:hypothetical protein
MTYKCRWLICICSLHLVAQSGYNVILNWSPSTTPGVTYNVYRGPDCTNVQRINQEPVPGPTYIDVGVPLGNLCYYTTSFLESESAPSNTAEVIIAPPTTLLTIQPAAVSLAPGYVQKFVAYRGTVPDTTVQWTLSDPRNPGADVGTISAEGMYTAPAQWHGNARTVDVIATGAGEISVATAALVK